jgi:hypothetical protein
MGILWGSGVDQANSANICVHAHHPRCLVLVQVLVLLLALVLVLGLVLVLVLVLVLAHVLILELVLLLALVFMLVLVLVLVLVMVLVMVLVLVLVLNHCSSPSPLRHLAIEFLGHLRNLPPLVLVTSIRVLAHRFRNSPGDQGIQDVQFITVNIM